MEQKKNKHMRQFGLSTASIQNRMTVIVGTHHHGDRRIGFLHQHAA